MSQGTPDSPELQLEQRFKALIAELRCLVCQNQSLADSNADLAIDMRREVHKMMEQGSTDEEIVQFLVDRYGDFVRYRPPVKSTTVLLWFGPFLLLAIGLVVVLAAVRHHKTVQPQSMDESQQQRVRELLDNHDPDQNK